MQIPLKRQCFSPALLVCCWGDGGRGAQETLQSLWKSLHGHAPSRIFAVLLCSSFTREPGGKITKSHSRESWFSCILPCARGWQWHRKAFKESHFDSLSFFLKSGPCDRSRSRRRKSPLPWGSYWLIGYRRKDRAMHRAAAELGRSQLLSLSAMQCCFSKGRPTACFASSLSPPVLVSLWLSPLLPQCKKWFFALATV